MTFGIWWDNGNEWYGYNGHLTYELGRRELMYIDAMCEHDFCGYYGPCVVSA